MPLRARDIDAFLARAGAAVLVRVDRVLGSTPRETDAFMLVSADGMCGTIGGGQLEFIAVDSARQMLRKRERLRKLNVPLGPEIGQCCGGRVELLLEFLDGPIAADLTDGAMAAEAAQPHVYVFGAGHVGRALANALAPMPFRSMIADTRPDALEGLPADIETKVAALPEALVRSAGPGSAFVVLTHDHALDFFIMREILLRGDAAYAGMIGSKTKRAQFRRWFLGEGGAEAQLTGLTCPIGAQGLGDKRPEIIAALVLAEIIVKFGRNDRLSVTKNAKLAEGVGVTDGK